MLEVQESRAHELGSASPLLGARYPPTSVAPTTCILPERPFLNSFALNPYALFSSPRRLLHSHRAIACDSLVKPKEEGLVLDFSDWPESDDGLGVRGPACYVRAVQAGRLSDPRKKSS